MYNVYEVEKMAEIHQQEICRELCYRQPRSEHTKNHSTITRFQSWFNQYSSFSLKKEPCC